MEHGEVLVEKTGWDDGGGQGRKVDDAGSKGGRTCSNQQTSW